MEIASVMLAIGGDSGNTVAKFSVTASEIAVLRAIHGEDSVTDIEVVRDEPRTNKAERERLAAVYGRTKDDNQNLILAQLFPGAAARLFEKVAELELPEQFFKATSRSSGAPIAPVEPAQAAPVAPAKPITKAQQKAADKAAAKAAEAAENDGIGEMDDSEGVLA